MTEKKRRPGRTRAANTGTLTLVDTAALERHAEEATRAAALRAAACELFEAEAAGEHLMLCPNTGEMGRLAAQYLDFADLIEVADREGWWNR